MRQVDHCCHCFLQSKVGGAGICLSLFYGQNDKSYITFEWMTSLYSKSYFCWECLGQICQPFFFLLFALDHTEYCVNQCIIYLACIGIGVLFLCLQHVRRVWGQRLKNVEFSKDTWMVHCISLKKKNVFVWKRRCITEFEKTHTSKVF